MLCLKCGNEYEGASCPRCEGPQVLVNNDDYLRRKRAYEEKQAAKRSASSDNEEVKTENELDSLVRVAGKISDAIAKKKETTKAKTKSQKSEGASDEIAENEGFTKAKMSNRSRLLYIAVPIVLVALVAVVIAVTFLGSSNSMYLRYENNIYKINGDKSELVCADDVAFFEADGTRFYKTDLPEQYADMHFISRQAAEGGKYFATTVYDEATAMYSLVLWDDNKTVSVAESSMQLDVLYASADGRVVYTATEVVNYEGAVGAYELYVYEADNKKKPMEGGMVKQLEAELRHAYVLVSVSQIVYINDAYNLCAYDYSAKKGVVTVAENVNCVYTMDNGADDLYGYNTGYVSISDKSTGIIYNADGRCYYMDLKVRSDEGIYIGKAKNASAKIVYKKNQYIYSIDGNVLEYTTMKTATAEDGETKRTELATTQIGNVSGQSEVIWNSKKNTLVYVNDKNELCMVVKGIINVLVENVSPNTLKCVEGSKQGLVYASQDKWYYKKDFNSNVVEIRSLFATSYIKNALYRSGKLYILTDDKKLYQCNNNVSSINELVLADYIWLVAE